MRTVEGIKGFLHLKGREGKEREGARGEEKRDGNWEAKGQGILLQGLRDR